MKTALYCLSIGFLINVYSGQANKIGKPPLIGSVYRDITELNEFKGYKQLEGILIQPIETHYALAEIAKGKHTIILFDKVLAVPNSKKVQYQILDTVTVGEIGSGKIIMMTSCRINKKDDCEIIGLVKNAGKETYYSLLKAWRANRKTNKFEKIPVKGISCVDLNFDPED